MAGPMALGGDWRAVNKGGAGDRGELGEGPVLAPGGGPSEKIGECWWPGGRPTLGAAVLRAGARGNVGAFSWPMAPFAGAAGSASAAHSPPPPPREPKNPGVAEKNFIGGSFPFCRALRCFLMPGSGKGGPGGPA